MLLILLYMPQKESKSYFQKCRFLAQQVKRGILLAIFSQYLTDTFTLLSSKFNNQSSSKGILQFLHSYPGVIFSFLQFRQTFFYLKYLLGCIVFTTVVRFISLRLIRDIFFFSFYSLSISSSAYSLLKRIGGYPRLQSCSSNISRSQGFFCLVCVLICCIICESICSFIFSAYSGGKFKTVTNSLEKSVGESLSFDKSQSNLSLMMVFQSRGMSISIDTSFLSSVNLRRPSLGLLSLYFNRSSLVKGSITKGRFYS